jgi:exocyst complex component 1
MLLSGNDGVLAAPGRRPVMAQHQEMESYLGRYTGLIIYLKEMDESIYAKLCAVRITWHPRTTPMTGHLQVYFSAASELHGIQMKKMLSMYATFVKKVSEDTQESSSWCYAAGQSSLSHLHG